MTGLALCILSYRPLLDRVHTAAVWTRYLNWPSCSRRSSRSFSLSGRNTSLTLSLLIILRRSTNSTQKEAFTAMVERYYISHGVNAITNPDGIPTYRALLDGNEQSTVTDQK